MALEFDKHNGNEQGNFILKQGEHGTTWIEFSKLSGFTRRRRKIIRRMRPMLLHMRDVGCKFVNIDGSFVTSKINPNDFDGTLDPEGVDITKLDPIIKNEDKFSMKEKYFGELYRQNTIEAGTGNSFDEFFQVDRFNNSKGVVIIDLVRFRQFLNEFIIALFLVDESKSTT